MQNLHAYWRYEYIKAPKQDTGERKNPFVTLPQMGDDEKALIVYRSKTSYLVLNRFPYNPGHLLAVPFRQVADLEELDATERADLMDLIIKGKEILKRAMNPNGFNIGFNFGEAAGAGIPCHLHCHIVPRWDGDTNFMPVLGETRVLPQALTDTWAHLKNAIT